MKEYILKDINETQAWAREFARTLRAPVAVALHGDLGMGKSFIARTIIQELCGADTVVPSPTFTLVQSYEVVKRETQDDGPLQRLASCGFRISHFDLYRITDPAELEEIGLSHACANDITLIEWPEIAAHILPADTIHLHLEQEGEGRILRMST
ncbi:MAG: tRNA (adenosine(37)-N6)-threonylcarbamoyltransferase complex ATPase subunit type 1 TsaE [Alphaproteobacteria bacterium]|nr:tRNA (adenosine(37)-N6)-threonylcarbamoyltransferase complex ATPase subunit type 1 TsaE [Alphaproteobacteria bacterium]MCL2757737.1 tRNA (adenosine(37)-N6)-threonylcarbamoyltransferase complex ATPase subunit type 1 TsaE [Alphaproteobacteria bacterium]